MAESKGRGRGSRASAAAAEAEAAAALANWPLPVPEPVVEHHSRTLDGPMNEWISRERVPPVLLLTGIAGVGKRTMAYYLAQWVFCERNGFGTNEAGGGPATDGDAEPTIDLFGGGGGGAAADALAEPAARAERAPYPCGECANCHRALKANWVDFTEIQSEDGDDGDAGDGSGGRASTGTLKIDQFRKLKGHLGFGAHQARYRIILIANAERMTAQAANSMLKILEEPPPGWVFFLTAKDATLLLPTIVSRCQALRLRPIPVETLETLLERAGVDAKRRRICATLAQGSWSKATRLADADNWERRKSVFAFFRDPRGELSGLVDWASTDPTKFDLLMDQLEHGTADLVRWSLQPDRAAYEWLNADGRDALAAHAEAVTKRLGDATAARDFWLERGERIARVRQEALTPLNRKLLVQDVLLPWLESGGA